MALSPKIGELTEYLDDYPDVDRHSCQLLGPTALVVQALMGLFVILSLIYKRQREESKRPWKIWMYDVSKQIVGQMFVHGVNVLMSDLVAHHSSSNACVPYFLNILLDTTLGVGMLYLILYGLTYIFTDKLGLKGFESGKYGSPPSISYWARQATVYVLSLTTMKLMVFVLFALFPGLFDIGEWLLSWTWTEKGDGLQVIFTMGIFPITMNVVQFWLIDSIVKASGAVALPIESARNSLSDPDHEPLFVAPSDDEDEGERPRYDIENPRPPSNSSSMTTDKPDTGQSTPSVLENKLTRLASTPISGNVTATHSYPPSIASTSTASSVSPPKGTSPKRLRKQFKRRPAPPPLDLASPIHPAANIPAEKDRVPEEANKEWDDSWDDSDDWANKVGEDEWTGRRIAEKKDSLNTWVATTVHTGV